jgi:RNA polymerase primary sigma factor
MSQGLDERAGHQLLLERVESALALLTSRERAVIELRFGLKDGRVRSWRMVGEELGLTTERARQIEARGLERLRRRKRVPDTCA